MEALNILWQIFPISQGTIGILKVTVKRGSWHHNRLKAEVEGARASIEDEKA